VTVTLGSVFRAVLTVARTGFIWLFDVALFYSPLGRRRLGEPFDPVASTVQMIGFGLGIVGTLLYAYGSSRCASSGKPASGPHVLLPDTCVFMPSSHHWILSCWLLISLSCYSRCGTNPVSERAWQCLSKVGSLQGGAGAGGDAAGADDAKQLRGPHHRAERALMACTLLCLVKTAVFWHVLAAALISTTVRSSEV